MYAEVTKAYENGNLKTVTDAEGNKIEYGYDGRGNKLYVKKQ